MCSEVCSNAPTHKPECQMTLTRGQPISIDIGNPGKPFPLYETVCIMRCLSLKLTAPEKYKAIMSLEPHTEERQRNGRYATLHSVRFIFKGKISIVDNHDLCILLISFILAC